MGIGFCSIPTALAELFAAQGVTYAATHNIMLVIAIHGSAPARRLNGMPSPTLPT
ncbi:MAG: hypothetical protein ACRD59_10905 [Candidatus Acidiferrales bacterium]